MKKEVIKVTSFVLTATILGAMLTACGKEQANTDGDTVTISVSNWPQTEGTELDNMNARKEKFEKDNPNIKIVPDAWDFDIKSFYAKAAGGQLPTVYATHFTEIKQIMEAGYSADMTESLKKRGYDGKLNKRIVDIVSDENGNICAFPFNTYMLGIGCNTDMFEKAGLMEADGTPKAPQTWDELAEFAVKIKEATGKPGFIFPTTDRAGGWMFTCLAWSFGTKFMQQSGDGKWKATFDSPETAAALQWIKDLKWKYDVLPSNTLIDNSERYKQFGTENVGMIMAPGDFGGTLASYGMDPNHEGMIGVPAGPKRHVTMLGGSVYCISNKATEAQIDAALKWIETQYSYNASEDYKINQENFYKELVERNALVGVKGLSVWDGDTEAVKYRDELIKKYENSNPNHVKLYNEFVENSQCEIQAEEPVCCQGLYSVLDSCIQEVLSNKDADCAALLKSANANFQSDYLDNLDY